MTAASGTGKLDGLFPPGQVTPIELGGLSSVLHAICPGEITADIQVGRTYRLDASEIDVTAEQRETLKAGPGEPACIRTGDLVDAATGRPAASVTAVILIRRVPWQCRRALRLTAAAHSVSVPGRTVIPLGTALRQCNVYRVQKLYSQALLETTTPIALLTERVYSEFLERYPPPWPGVPGTASSPVSYPV